MRKLSKRLPIFGGRPSKSENGATTSKVTRQAPHKVTPMEVRELNELIRLRYALDNKIWGQRQCSPTSRPLVEENMRRADAALRKIMSMVEAWDTPEVWDSQSGDWERLREIRRKLEMGGKRVWADHPPWEERKPQPLYPQGI